MKKTIILLLSLFFICSLFTQQLDVFPKTNVWVVNLNDVSNPADLNQGIDRLRTVYDEDELVILIIDGEGSSNFNDEPVLLTNTFLKFGQPVWELMEYERFRPSEFYVHNLVMDNDSVSFTFMAIYPGFSPAAYAFVNVIMVEKDTNIARWNDFQQHSLNSLINNTTSVNPPAEYMNGNYKAVVLINIDGMPQAAASTERVLKPFRVVALPETSFSFSGESSSFKDSGKIHIVSTDFDNEGMVDVKIIKEEVYISESSWMTTFCDSILCYFGSEVDIELPKGYYDYLYVTFITPSPGMGLVNMTVSSGDYNVVIPYYFYTDDVEILVILEDANENTQQNIIDVLRPSGISFGILKLNLLYENTDFSFISSNYTGMETIIWLASPAAPNYSLVALNNLSTAIYEGRNLFLFGQYVAMYLDFYGPGFLANVLNADFIPNSTTSFEISDSSFMPLNFTLRNDGSALSHYSRNSIQPINDALPMLFDGDSNVKGVFSNVFLGRSFFADFDFNSINEPAGRSELIYRVLIQWGHVSEDNPDIPVSKPLNITAYPNPFNPNVSFDITTDDLLSPLNVSIFNIRGQKINELMNSVPQTNNITLTWNGNDSTGREMSSGIYFIRAISDNETSSKRIILMK